MSPVPPSSRCLRRPAAQPAWPRPPACLTAQALDLPPSGARVAVAGIVLCRQRPGTAKGVIFLTLEDETGTANIVVWAKIYERFRRAVIAGRCLKVTGRLQREGDVVHVVAETIEDISPLLDRIVTMDGIAAAGPEPLELPPAREPHLQGSRRGSQAVPGPQARPRVSSTG
jgi:single-strand DNA-binding protein